MPTTNFPKTIFAVGSLPADRMQRTAKRVDAIRKDVEDLGLADDYTLADVAIKYCAFSP